MSDTIRTQSQLLTIFADNTVGAITAQSMRDLVVTMFDNNNLTVTAKTSNYTVAANDYLILANHASGSFTITLADATTVSSRFYIIKSTSSVNSVTLATTAGQTIGGNSSIVISNFSSCVVVSDGANWFII